MYAMTYQICMIVSVPAFYVLNYNSDSSSAKNLTEGLELVLDNLQSGLLQPMVNHFVTLFLLSFC